MFFVSGVSREGRSDGNAAMESLHPITCSSLQEAGAMSDETKCDVGSGETKEVAASRVDTEIPPRAWPAMLPSRQPGEMKDCGTPSGGHSSQTLNVQSCYGRQWRKTKHYFDWV